MYSTKYLLSFSALAAFAQAHVAILNAQGIAGSPASVGFQVQKDIARNCTSINPCQQDTTIIRDVEIANNVVNECGRTELSGNIDIGENTENAIAAGAVTQVKSGTKLTVTLHQVNADGAGPFVCDLVEAGNNGVISSNLTVENNVPGVNGFSQAKEQDFNITVTMPQSFKCTGSSQGNICTVRCRNNAQAGPFGGCFPVQQTDTTANVNSPANIQTGLDLAKADKQTAVSKAAFADGVKSIQDQGAPEALAAAAQVSKLLNISPTTSAFPQLTPTVDLGNSNTGNTNTNTGNNNNANNGNSNSRNGNGRNSNSRNGNNNNRQRRSVEFSA